MSRHHYRPISPRSDIPLGRRDLLRRAGMGMGGLALAQLLGEDAVRAASEPRSLDPLAARKPPLPARARRVIHLFLNGGVSQVDTFDPKPALETYAGKPLPATFKTEGTTGGAFPSPWKFKKRGKSGLEISDLFEKIAGRADDLCIVRSMHSDLPNHEPSLLLMNCGEVRQSRPSVGAWVTYGLGTENRNLPGFVVLCPGGYPLQEAQNWQAGFLPGSYQGTYVDSAHTELDKLIANIRSKTAGLAEQRRQLDALAALNHEHQARRGDDPSLEARIQGYELAFHMQMEAADVFDLQKEPQGIRDLYGAGVQGRQLLIARRLLERGVRFVQVWTGQGQPWDHHSNIVEEHARLARECDQPIAALLTDLKQRGMLEDTLVVCSGEFGRTPAVQLRPGQTPGRDHDHYGFSLWLAGGGVKGGIAHGATDDFGWKAVDHPVHIHDLHATMLHLLGFDHEAFTYRHAGRDFRLTDVHGKVVSKILA